MEGKLADALGSEASARSDLNGLVVEW